MILRMSDDKSLYLTQSSVNYENENDAEYITVLFPQMYNEIPIVKCSPVLFLSLSHPEDDVSGISAKSDDKTPGDFIQLIFSDTLYNGTTLQTVPIPLSSKYTCTPGKISVWIELINGDGLVLKTSVASILIKEHKAASEILPEYTPDMFDSILLKVQGYVEKCEQLTALVIDLADELEKKYGSLEKGSE